ncbi:4Fe-4S dicluster domain-containing protein [Salisediminibacterium beveridgei]|uniref:Anaerobic dimethyl sulfoxide reductase chain B n=1 Tax=Salisediminibacterium beveridgei TaxID=632773 RepID=A0A1D7QX81_9BACI|nr:4Fe-4S dicluster domain-containing protein [Salisediminibacterium beveridgei]AOM83615.1 Anaerobic dimethyl sulfoxide reductase chain B [Salisediminibacterium beveridgei]
MKMGFVVDSDRCIGCHSCSMACKNYNQLNPKISWRKVYDIQEDAYGEATRTTMSLACNHCDIPSCKEACPTNAYEKREDGIVIHHEDRCIGCEMCIYACPYNIPQFDQETKKVSKCHFCYERLEEGKQPACISSCPTQAIYYVDVDSFGLQTDRSLPGFPDYRITEPTTRFIKPFIVKKI